MHFVKYTMLIISFNIDTTSNCSSPTEAILADRGRCPRMPAVKNSYTSVKKRAVKMGFQIVEFLQHQYYIYEHNDFQFGGLKINLVPGRITLYSYTSAWCKPIHPSVGGFMEESMVHSLR